MPHFNTYEEAVEALDAECAKTGSQYPKEIYTYPHRQYPDIEFNAWNGHRRFKGQDKWTSSNGVLISDDETKLYLGEYWCNEALYQRITPKVGTDLA